MKVFKFGGASIKSANAIKNMGSIVQKYIQEELLIVVSAMGKTTNALEELLSESRAENLYSLENLTNYHIDICNELFAKGSSTHEKVNILLNELNSALEKKYDSYDRHYDQVISFGELLSSQIRLTSKPASF